MTSYCPCGRPQAIARICQVQAHSVLADENDRLRAEIDQLRAALRDRERTLAAVTGARK